LHKERKISLTDSKSKFQQMVNSIKAKPNIQTDRIKAVHEIINSPEFLDYYDVYIDHYIQTIDAHPYGITKKTPLTENNTFFRQIEMMTNNILYARDKQGVNKKADYKSYSPNKLKIRLNNKKNLKFADFNFIDEDGERMHPEDMADTLYYNNASSSGVKYKCNDQQIFKDDYQDSDYETTVKINKSGELVREYSANALSCYEDCREYIKDNAKKTENYKDKIFRQRSLMLNDQIEIKNAVKKPIRFRHVIRGNYNK